MAMKIGDRIKNLRQARELTHEELANRANLTKGFISQVERDRTSISLDSLEQILKALDIPLTAFFAELAEEKIVFSRAERLKVSRSGVEGLEILIPGATNRRMDPVLVTLGPEEILTCGNPHDGEEFGFVMSGRVNLKVGSKHFKVKRGECFYYKASREHAVANKTHAPAQILWIASPPQL